MIVAIGGYEPTRQGLEMAAINGWVNLFAGKVFEQDVEIKWEKLSIIARRVVVRLSNLAQNYRLVALMGMYF
ncbi:MAG: hypothetical protein PUP91_36295 [Rhizonema sp. PD37]|nr:hypothetical protein [Rhizonema sp. PD37]